MHESQIHAACARYLEMAGFPYGHDRTDKRTRTKIGEPDFRVYWKGRVLFVELKVIGGKLSPDQKKRHAQLEAAGCTVAVCYSVEEFITAVTTWAGTHLNWWAAREGKPLDCIGVPLGEKKGKADVL